MFNTRFVYMGYDVGIFIGEDEYAHLIVWTGDLVVVDEEFEDSPPVKYLEDRAKREIEMLLADSVIEAEPPPMPAVNMPLLQGYYEPFAAAV